jgi:hypothetical protein
MEEDGISKSNTPKERWQLLRMFIKNRNLNVQHKRSHAFGLFTSCKITDLREVGFENFDDSCEVEDDYEWLEYTCEHFHSCRLAVRLVYKISGQADITQLSAFSMFCSDIIGLIYFHNNCYKQQVL